MPDISLTDFTGFSLRVGISKLRKVEEIRNRPSYSPAFDFWKQLREAIVEHHKNGKALDVALKNLTDQRKLNRYPGALKAYKVWMKGKEIKWFNPPSGSWKHQALTVRVTPELGLNVDGVAYVVKLHFKDEPLTKGRIVVPLQLMQTTLKTPARVAMLDVGKGKLLPFIDGAADATPLLLGEAAAFLAMWNEI
jgi:hypothetical protein